MQRVAAALYVHEAEAELDQRELERTVFVSDVLDQRDRHQLSCAQTAIA